MKKTLLIILFLLQTWIKLFSATMFDPELKWRSIKTDHFWIHFHQGLEEQAKKLSVIAENVHERLSPVIQWEPALRTDVVLVDNMYTANGFATPFPYNRVQIYLSRPEIDTVLNNFDNWLEMVFTHEYTHILNMDTIHGFPSLTRYIFGRCLFPNVYVPVWMLEGNAVYQESGYSRFGRNNSTYTDMVMRTEILYLNLKPISEASNFPREWPVGNVPYLYGGLFVDFLEKKYGKGSFARIFTDNSYNLLPYYDNTIPYVLPFLKSSSEYIYGESFLTLWKEWEEFLKIKYNRQIENIKKQQVTEYKKITKSGHSTSIPRFSKNSKNIYYIRNTNYNKPALMSYSPETGGNSVLCRVNDPNSISVANDERIYLSDAELYRSFSVYNEAFIYKNNYKRLTSRLKGSYIDISSDGQNVCFVKQDKNKFSLILSDPLFENSNRIINNSDMQIAFTRFSPDGKKIAFTLKDKNGNADIAVIDIATKDIQRLSDDAYNDIHPAWHPDGNSIIFSSDRDGVYNLYEYDLRNKEIAKITNMIGGAFSPDISADGKTIAFTCYEKNGFDLAIMEYPPEKHNDEKADEQKIPIDYFEKSWDNVLSGEESKSTNFNVFNSLFPPFWLPVFGNSEVYNKKYQYLFGFYTLGADTLYRNMYVIECYAYTFEKRANTDINYLLSYFYPDIILQYHNDALFYGKDKFPWEDKNQCTTKREIERSGTIGMAIPLYYYLSSHIVSLSYKYSRSYTDLYYPAIATERYKNTEAKIRAKYSYSNAAEYSYSVSKEDGRDFYIISDIYRKEFGSDLSYSKIMGEYAEYLPGLWRNNVLMTRLRGGASFDNPAYKDPYSLGRFKKGDTGTSAADEHEFGLRGYPYGSIFGKRIAVGAVEYRLPIVQRDLGLATFPLMFRDIWLTPFVEYGNVWGNETNIKEFKSSAGAELNIRITLGYALDLQGYIGYARGFNEYGEDQVYFAVSMLFEGAFKNNYKWLDYL